MLANANVSKEVIVFSRSNDVESGVSTNTGLREDVAALKGDMSALRHDVLAAGRHSVQTASHKLGEVAGKTKSAVKSAINDLDLRADDLRSAITQNPLVSVAAAIAIGFFLGRAVTRRM